MNELNLFPETQQATTQLMFVNFGIEEEKYCMPILQEIRKAGINAEIFPEAAKMKKQMTYANNKRIPYVMLIGENEMQQGKVTLKNMETGIQEQFETGKLLPKIIEKFSNK
jgi:histidyl-tRNA synthetase